MANKRGKEVDTTELSIARAIKRGLIHRDYIAHCIRFSYFHKEIRRKNRWRRARVLDIGCGSDAILGVSLYTACMKVPHYLGIDMGRITAGTFTERSNFNRSLHENTDVISYFADDDKVFDEDINVIACYEVAEHVEPVMMRGILETAYKILYYACIKEHDEQTLGFEPYMLISTPCYDKHVGAADNHVNEMTYEAFGAVLETYFKIEHHQGTFASQKDYKHLLTPAQREVFDELSPRYESNVLSNIFAPLPNVTPHARNCMWKVVCRRPGDARMFPALEDCATPWGSSSRWMEMATCERA